MLFLNSSHFEIFVNNHTSSESFYLAFLSKEGTTSPVGTYTVAKDHENPVAGEFLPGYKQFSTFANTWCYIFYEGKYEAGGAPATEGTIIITEVQGKPDTYHIEYEMYDDAEPKHKVVASWTGKIKMTNY